MAGIQLCFRDESIIGVLFDRWLKVDSRRYFFLVFFAAFFADGGLSGSFGLSLITNSPNWKEIKSSDIISRSRILLATLAARWGGVAEKTLHSFWRWTTSMWKRWNTHLKVFNMANRPPSGPESFPDQSLELGTEFLYRWHDIKL